MANHLYSSPSSLCTTTHKPLSTSLPPSPNPKHHHFPTTFFNPNSFPPKSKPHFHVKNVSLQNPIPTNKPNPQYPDEKITPSSKNYIWVNPNSPRASKLQQFSYDARYDSLSEIAQSLNSCNPVYENVSVLLNELVGDRMLEQDAVIILNNMVNPKTAPIALKVLRKKFVPSREVILYNVTLKVFRKCKELDGAEKLFGEMIDRGVKPDNVTFSTLISCARMCSLPSKAVEWFEMMPKFGCDPDAVTYSVMIDAYGRAGNVDMAMSLYDRARTEKWRIDPVTFSTLIRIYTVSGNFDGCLNVYEEMKALGVKPNLVIYNTLLEAMGRARRPWQAKAIYREMTNNGFLPSWATYAALLRAYARARYGEDTLVVYKEMKEKGIKLNVILYNTLLAMCADVGLTDEAVEIFEDMKNSGTCKPDSWTFSSLITIYSCSGRVTEAEDMINEMLEAGAELNLFVFTSLIQCYGKASRTDDVVKTFDRILNLGITLDERFSSCLLNVMTQTPREELGKLTVCIEKAHPKLGRVVKFLVEGQSKEGEFKIESSILFSSISADVKKAYCNCLIDLCVNLDQLDRACELFDLGLTLYIYKDIQSRSPTQWSLHLKSLSLGAALTALHIWMNDLSRAVEEEEELPLLLGINTGHGKHKFSDKGLAGVFESHLKELNAPFHEVTDKVGWFLTTKEAAKSWLESRLDAAQGGVTK